MSKYTTIIIINYNLLSLVIFYDHYLELGMVISRYTIGLTQYSLARELNIPKKTAHKYNKTKFELKLTSIIHTNYAMNSD